MKCNKVYFAKTALALAALALAGCGAVKKDEDASVIKEKSVARWNLLIAHQAEKAYDYLTPGYRQTKDRATYAKEMNERGVHWSKVAYNTQDCDAQVCHVRLMIDYSLHLPGPAGTVNTSSPLTETWVKLDGAWYYLPDPLPPKPGSQKS